MAVVKPTPKDTEPTRTYLPVSGSFSNEFPYLSPPERSDELGRLAGYRILRLLGQGGMGQVFVAEDMALLRQVALKVMRPLIAADASARERFLREGQAAAALRSPQVVTLYHVGEINGLPYLVMELLQGQSLDQWLQTQTGPATEAVVVKVARDVLLGLQAAHEQGLIHRDIKPANLWLERQPPGVKLLDFGLTRSVAAPHLTHTGMVMGTPAYMPFEQANAQPLDARSDLYSLGAVLYRMIMGRPPFERETTMATLLALAIDEPPPLVGVSPGLTAFLSRLMARNPDNRPASAAQALQELDALQMPVLIAQALNSSQKIPNVWKNIDDESAPQPLPLPVPAPPVALPPLPWWRSVGVLALVAVCVLVGAGLAVFFQTKRTPPSTALSGTPPMAAVTPPPAVPVVPSVVVEPPPLPKPPALAPRTRWLEFTGQTEVELPGLTLSDNGPLTVEAWVYPGEVAQTQPILDLRGPSRYLRLYSNPQFGMWVADTNSSADLHSFSRTSQRTPAGEWVHLAMTWQGKEPTLFVNGVLETAPAVKYPALVFPPGAGRLGRGPTDGAALFVGRLGGVRFSSNIRYTAAFTPPLSFTPDEQTVALYPCDDGTGTVLRDLSAHQRHGRIQNGFWATERGPSLALMRQPLFSENLAGWRLLKQDGVQSNRNTVTLTGPGHGLVSTTPFGNLDLTCELWLDTDTVAALAFRSNGPLTDRTKLVRTVFVGTRGTARKPSPLLEQLGALEVLNLVPERWNTVRARLVGSTLRVWVNGLRPVDMNLQDEKYRTVPALQAGLNPTGGLAILSDGPKLQIRNLGVANGVVD
jgi:serine/threonine protein kinase